MLHDHRLKFDFGPRLYLIASSQTFPFKKKFCPRNHILVINNISVMELFYIKIQARTNSEMPLWD